jgi:DNA gyrase inhibitor GyrI
MQFQIEDMPRQKVIYMRHIGPYGAGNKELMENLKCWAKDNGILNESSIILGIARDDPAVTLPANCRYDVCITVAEQYEKNSCDKDINITVLPGEKYAVFTIGHTAEDIQKAWMEIMPGLTRKGFHIDISRPILERYAPDMISKHLCEICVPV